MPDRKPEKIQQTGDADTVAEPTSAAELSALGEVVGGLQQHVEQLQQEAATDLQRVNQAIQQLSGFLHKLQAVQTDISRRDAERERLLETERMRASEARFLETLIEGVSASIAYLDIDFRFIRVNNAFARLVGATKAELVGRTYLDILAFESDVGALLRRVRETAAQVEQAEVSYIVRGKPEIAGRYVDMVFSPVVRQNGTVEGIIISAFDVTAKVEQREQLLASEQARVRHLETINAEINHRTKNNLALIAGMLEFRAGEVHDERLASVLEETAFQLHAFAGIHEELQYRQEQSVDLTACLRRITGMLGSSMPEGSAELEVVGDSLFVASRDATNLMLVVSELITNALKHGGPGPDGIMHVRIALAREDRRLRLSVWNSGVQVPLGFDASRSAHMGLNLVQGVIVDQYQGSFSLRPQQDGTLAEAIVDEVRVGLDTSKLPPAKPNSPSQ
jgi:PAS domain S-box-containing protein